MTPGPGPGQVAPLSIAGAGGVNFILMAPALVRKSGAVPHIPGVFILDRGCQVAFSCNHNKMLIAGGEVCLGHSKIAILK